MEIGRLQHRGIIATYTESQNPGNPFKVKTFTTLYTLWMQVVANKRKTYFGGAQTESKITHKATIRYQVGISAENWIIWDGRYFRIRGIKDQDEKHRWLELECEEVGLAASYFQAGFSVSGNYLGVLL